MRFSDARRIAVREKNSEGKQGRRSDANPNTLVREFGYGDDFFTQLGRMRLKVCESKINEKTGKLQIKVGRGGQQVSRGSYCLTYYLDRVSEGLRPEELAELAITLSEGVARNNPVYNIERKQILSAQLSSMSRNSDEYRPS